MFYLTIHDIIREPYTYPSTVVRLIDYIRIPIFSFDTSILSHPNPSLLWYALYRLYPILTSSTRLCPRLNPVESVSWPTPGPRVCRISFCLKPQTREFNLTSLDRFECQVMCPTSVEGLHVPVAPGQSDVSCPFSYHRTQSPVINPSRKPLY